MKAVRPLFIVLPSSPGHSQFHQLIPKILFFVYKYIFVKSSEISPIYFFPPETRNMGNLGLLAEIHPGRNVISKICNDSIKAEKFLAESFHKIFKIQVPYFFPTTCQFLEFSLILAPGDCYFLIVEIYSFVELLTKS